MLGVFQRSYQNQGGFNALTPVLLFARTRGLRADRWTQRGGCESAAFLEPRYTSVPAATKRAFERNTRRYLHGPETVFRCHRHVPQKRPEVSRGREQDGNCISPDAAPRSGAQVL